MVQNTPLTITDTPLLSTAEARTVMPPLHKHTEIHYTQTGSPCLDKALLASDLWYEKKVCSEKLPIPHPDRTNSTGCQAECCYGQGKLPQA